MLVYYPTAQNLPKTSISPSLLHSIDPSRGVNDCMRVCVKLRQGTQIDRRRIVAPDRNRIRRPALTTVRSDERAKRRCQWATTTGGRPGVPARHQPTNVKCVSQLIDARGNTAAGQKQRFNLRRRRRRRRRSFISKGSAAVVSFPRAPMRRCVTSNAIITTTARPRAKAATNASLMRHVRSTAARARGCKRLPVYQWSGVFCLTRRYYSTESPTPDTRRSLRICTRNATALLENKPPLSSPKITPIFESRREGL
uniref:Uncharacterized protein n=1 Tax=Plectus sambesii TaxID=2011161 RepID=A0A914ULZ9_9BILA